jgi:hypothetical protein
MKKSYEYSYDDAKKDLDELRKTTTVESLHKYCNEKANSYVVDSRLYNPFYSNGIFNDVF